MNVPSRSFALAGGLVCKPRMKTPASGYFAGLDARNERSVIVRLNRGDGVRAELFFEEPDPLSWRTLGRDPKAVSTPNGWLRFMLDAPPQAKSTMPLSEMCLVSRLFWESA